MIHTRDLVRHFKAKGEVVKAVQGVDLDVVQGEIVAFLGPNGAGKSTTLRMLTTLLPATSGEAKVAGFDVRANPDAVRGRIGYIGQKHGASEGQQVRDELVAQGRIYGLGSVDAGKRADELLDQLELAEQAKRYVATLSGGQKRRLDVALGLIHRPDLLFLDEPSTGLDPHSRANLWTHITGLREQYGTTIFLTTHYLDEADTAAERVIVIDHGRIIAEGTPDQLKAKVSGDLVTVEFGEPEAAARAVAIGEALPGAHEVNAEGSRLTLRVEHGDEALPMLVRALDTAEIRLRGLNVSRPSLDDVFLSLTGRSLREESA
ncbi:MULTISPECIES: ATP-binding cassette domain-containing protein [unclassified Crossiella]|uniref:ATP-binding cassette domain-containing protein n=1 Tax=unclassified Crossiella TaxID=2620835 RepID=UPI0020001F49|nr:MULTISPECIES: ATP-binding cassette domain-containing protein [unclassified Crossiella]MCK2238892.1 ATP-binding cassette domain-containing protein [Crossiella sp. S99.2]MCK2251538.1 ATP-binding cassette domain-containing protein [Crossiella sp. S99.1]